MTDQQRYENYANRLIQWYQANMYYYRIIVVKNNIAQIEQVYTKKKLTVPVDELIKKCNGYMSSSDATKMCAVSNPSELVKYYKGKKEELYKRNEATIRKFDGITEESKTSILKDITDCRILVHNGGNYSSIDLSALANRKLRCFPILTNFETLKEALLFYLPLIDRVNIQKTIIQSIRTTFAYVFATSEIQNKGNKYKFTVQEKKGNDNSNTTLFFTVTKDSLQIAGKRHNIKLDKTYGLKSFRSYDTQYILKISARIFYDICKIIGFNPERFYLSSRALQQNFNLLTDCVYALKITEHNFTDNKYGGCVVGFKVKKLIDNTIIDGKAKIKFSFDNNSIDKSFSDFCDVAYELSSIYKFNINYKIGNVTNTIIVNSLSDICKEIIKICSEQNGTKGNGVSKNNENRIYASAIAYIDYKVNSSDMDMGSVWENWSQFIKDNTGKTLKNDNQVPSLLIESYANIIEQKNYSYISEMVGYMFSDPYWMRDGYGEDKKMVNYVQELIKFGTTHDFSEETLSNLKIFLTKEDED